MTIPSAKIENSLIKQGYKCIAGLDEVGRGALAGPIVAAAVIMPTKKKIYRLRGIKDSKLLNSKQRGILFDKIINSCLTWSVGIVSENEIDQQGIATANVLAMERAIWKLHLNVKPDYLLIDYLKLENIDLPQENVVNGDQEVYSIATASIIAKVVRDNILKAESRHYPEYGFNKHKGYGTKLHFKMIKKHGLLPIHRKTFEPIKSLVI